MNIGILVDATCDLPASIYERHKLNVIPTSFRVKNETLEDSRSLEFCNQFYQDYTAKKIAHAVSGNITNKDFIDRLKDNLIYHFDGLLVLTPHIKLSNSLQTIRESVFEIQPEIETLRRQASLTKSFKIRIVETDQAYAGYGLIVYEALRLMHEKARSVDQIKTPLSKFKTTVESYVLPGTEEFNSDKLSEAPYSLGWLEVKKAKLSRQVPIVKIDSHKISVEKQVSLQRAEQDFFDLIYLKLNGIRLANHLVNVSYAGKLAQLRVKPAFKDLHQQVLKKGGKLVHSLMSPSSAAHLGAGALSVSFSKIKE